MTDTSAPDRALIVLFGAIGDVVRALPLAQRIRAGWPKCEIAWTVEAAAAPIVQNHPAIDRVVTFDRTYRGLPPLLRQLRTFAPDVSLDLQRLLKSGIASWGSRAPRRIGFHWDNSREANWFFNTETIGPVDRFTAKIDHYLAFADLLGVPEVPISFGLTPTDSERHRVDELLADVSGDFVAFFVGASWKTKLWHAAPAAEVVDRLAERGLTTVLLGAPGDVATAREVAAAARSKTVDLTGRTKLRDLIGIFGRAAISFGPDSGPMHIAAAVGTPVVSLFGATSPKRSAPYGFDDLVLEGEAPCRPCYSRKCDIDRECMKAITADRVVAMIDEGRRLRPSVSLCLCGEIERSTMTNFSEIPWIADHIEQYRKDPEKAHMWDSSHVGGPGVLPTLLLTTTGRKSGEPRMSPLIYGKAGDGYIVIASKGGWPTHPHWYLNLDTKPECELQVGSEQMAARARVASGEERARLWKQMAELYPPYDEYQKSAGEREIPVVVLEPIG